MKKINTFAAMFLLVFFASCAKEESLLESTEMAPLYQHWALEFNGESVTGVPYSMKYPDATGLTSGYEFFKDGKGVDYGFTPAAKFDFEVKKDGSDKIITISKRIPTTTITSISDSHGNGFICNDPSNFTAEQQQSIEYKTITSSFRIAKLTQTSMQGSN